MSGAPSKAEKALLKKKAVDCYAHIMTTPLGEAAGWVSRSDVAVTAFDMWDNVSEALKGDPEAAIEIRRAVLQYAISGRPVTIDKKLHSLIEHGLCAYKKEDNTDNITLGEPLVIEAACNYLSLHDFVKKKLGSSSDDSSASGNNFEVYALPFIRDKFVKELFAGELGVQVADMGTEWPQLRLIGLSAYGVLARKCKTPEESLRWMEEIVASTIEGQVPPFCYPDPKMGPDLLFFLHDPENWGKRRLSLWQMKFKNVVNQLEAQRSVHADLLYHINRNKSQGTLDLAEELHERWAELRSTIFGEVGVSKRGGRTVKKRKIGALHVVLQAPSSGGRNAMRHAEQLDAAAMREEGSDVEMWACIDDEYLGKVFTDDGVEWMKSCKAASSSSI